MLAQGVRHVFVSVLIVFIISSCNYIGVF